MVSNIVGGASSTKMADAKFAARWRHDREQCRMNAITGPTQEDVRVDRRPIAARLIKGPLPLFPALLAG